MTSEVQLKPMRAEKTAVEAFTINDAPNLDAITVITEAWRPGAGRITLVCYGRAWTGSWGAMGDNTVLEFVAAANADYVADNMEWGQPILMKQYRAREREYLLRIIRAVQEFLRTKQEVA